MTVQIPQSSPEIYFQFAGTGSLTADTFALKTAMSRIAAGVSSEQVRQETGWFEGVDGKWRYEISDKEAVLHSFKSGHAQCVGDLMDHAKLFAAYPQTKSIPVEVVVSSNDSVSGRVVVEDVNSPIISLEVPPTAKPEQVKSVLLHEIQHVIQAYEGFARGGSKYEFNYRLDTLVVEMNEIDAASKAQNRVKFLGETPQQAYKFITESTKVPQDRIKYFAETYTYEELNKKFSDCLAQKKALDPYRAYLRLAGEVEARNVQARLELTDDERKSISPLNSQDMDSKDILIRFNGKDMHNTAVPNHMLGSASMEDMRAAVLLGGNQFAKILLGESADISSPLHEGGHLYLSILNDVANHPQSAPSIKEDFQIVLNWFGVSQTAWETFNPDQRRQYHEQFAESFELYMAEGRSPSVAIENEFRMFQGWMADIYTDITTQLPNAQLNDEIRGVFDRILASSDKDGRITSSVVSTQVKDELQAVGYEAQQAEAHATIFDAALKSFYSRSGMNEAEFLEKYKFSITQGFEPENMNMRVDERIERAKLQGFDTSKIWYHGSFSAFTEFDPERSGSSGFHFSQQSEFAEQYASSKSMDMELDADIVVRGFYLRGELFDFTNKDHLERLADQLPDHMQINGRYGMAAWFSGVEYSKAELIEAIQGIQIPYTGLDDAAKAEIRNGKSHFMREGGAQVVINYDAVTDKVEFVPRWEMDKIRGIEGSIQFYSRAYGQDYFEIPLLQRQLEREKANIIPQKLELNPKKTDGHDNWNLLESPELKEYLIKAGFDGAMMQEKRNLNAVVFDVKNIKEISALFNDQVNEKGHLYSQSNRYRKSDTEKSGMSIAEVKSSILSVTNEVRIPVIVVESASSLPLDIRTELAMNQGLKNTAGLYDPASKKAYLIADNIDTPKEAVLTYLHETGHAAFRAAVGLNYNNVLDTVYKSLTPVTIERLHSINESQINNMEPVEGKRLIAEEWIAEIAEKNPKNSIFQNVVSSIKNWLREIKPDILFNERDIVYLLSKGKNQLGQNENYNQTQVVSEINNSQSDAFKKLGENSNAFQFGSISGKQKIEETLKDVFKNEIEIEVLRNTGLFHTDPNAKAEFSVYLTKGSHSADVTIFNLNERECFEQIFSTKGSGLGAPLYQAIFSWAHNNQKCLTMDPEGITDINLLRRTEAAISSAIRYKSTEHIGMYPEAYVGLLPDSDYNAIVEYRKQVTQLVYDDSLHERSQLDIDQLIPPPLESYKRLGEIFEQKWKSERHSINKEDCFNSNITGMIEAANSLINRRLPEIKNFTLIDADKIIDMTTGNEVGRNQIPTNSDCGIGTATAIRAIIANSNMTPACTGEKHEFTKEFASGLLYRKSSSELSADRERWIRESSATPQDTTLISKPKGMRI